MIYILAYYPWLRFLGNLIVDKGLIQKRKEYAVHPLLSLPPFLPPHISQYTPSMLTRQRESRHGFPPKSLNESIPPPLGPTL